MFVQGKIYLTSVFLKSEYAAKVLKLYVTGKSMGRRYRRDTNETLAELSKKTVSQIS